MMERSLSGSSVASISGIGGAALARAHVYPDHAGPFGDLVGLRMNLLAKVLLRRQVRHVDAVALGVELPAVIDTANAALLVPCHRTATHNDVGSDGPSHPPDPRGRGTRSASRPAASGAADRRPATTSEDFTAGSQYCRIRSPIMVPGPTRVSCSLSIAFVMASLPAVIVGRQFAADKPKRPALG